MITILLIGLTLTIIISGIFKKTTTVKTREDYMSMVSVSTLLGMGLSVGFSLIISATIVGEWGRQFDVLYKSRCNINPLIIKKIEATSPPENIYIMKETIAAKDFMGLLKKIKSDPKMLVFYAEVCEYIQNASGVDLATLEQPDILFSRNISSRQLDAVYEQCVHALTKAPLVE